MYPTGQEKENSVCTICQGIALVLVSGFRMKGQQDPAVVHVVTAQQDPEPQGTCAVKAKNSKSSISRNKHTLGKREAVFLSSGKSIVLAK
jgi:hypothetical protein